jgi:hypothetical protein
MGLIFEKQPPQAAPLSTVRQQLDVALRMEKPADEAQID